VTKAQTKKLIVFLMIIGFIFNVSSPGMAQINPSWSNEEPSHNEPPNGGVFVRQDPIPKSLEDITIFSSTHKNVSLHIEFPDAFDYEVYFGPDGTGYRRYKADSRYKILAKPGQPEILSRLIQLQIPQDAKNFKIEDIKIDLKESSGEDVNIYPVPTIIFEKNKNQEYQREKEIFNMDEDFYKKDAWCPEENAEIVREGHKHGMHQIQIAVPAMIYNPIKRSLREFKAVSFNVRYQSESQDNKISKIDTSRDPFHKIFIDTIANYAYQKTEPSPNPAQSAFVEIPLEELNNPDWADETGFYPDYLVIAAKSFHEGDIISSALSRWASHRASSQGQGHKIAIAYTDEIYLKYFQEDTKEENIKDFIKMVYYKWRFHPKGPSLQYLLLVGDADFSHDNDNWFLPTWRTSDPNVFEGDAGDNDYAWLEEESEEYYESDVLLGRIPARTEGELAVMVDKITNFEHTQPTGENHYGTRMLWLGGNMLADFSHPENLCRDMIVDGGNNGELPAYELEEYNYDYEGGISEFQYDTDKIERFLNTHGALFVSYKGHGYPSTFYSHWTGWDPGVTVEKINNLGKLPLLILSLACSTARFDYANPDPENHEPFNSYGEDWIKKQDSGAICFFGATRLAGSTAMGSLPTFYRSIIEEGDRIIGVAIDKMRKDLGPNIGNNHKIYVFLGDPAINFSNHLQPSTKPDFKKGNNGVINPDPTQSGDIVKLLTQVTNNSSDDFNDVPYRLFSIKAGVPISISDTLTFNMPAYHGSYLDPFEWEYDAESTMNFMFWIDPNNLIEERSEFNNHINSSRMNFPIYVDQNHTGQEQGTKNYPYRDFSEALEHASEYDHVGEHYRRFGSSYNRKLKIFLQKGVYGQGDYIPFAKSVLIRGLAGANKTIIYDTLNLSGGVIAIEDVTFDGKKMNMPSLIRSSSADDYTKDRSESTSKVVRTIFKNSKDYALQLDSNELTLKNCIFYKNYGVACLYASYQESMRALYAKFITAHKNENGIKLDDWNEDIRRIEIDGSVFWENGPSIFPENFPSDNLDISIDYSDVDDTTLLNNISLESPPEGNILEDPKFLNPTFFDLHLKPNSPCVNAGAGNPPQFDPDGSLADMGTYGGPDAIIRPIRIKFPIHGETLLTHAAPPFEFNLDIRWSAYLLGSNKPIDIELYHMVYEPANPDERGQQYNAIKVIDLDISTVNSGTYLATIEQATPTQSYWMTITNHDNTEEFEKINFKITSESSSIKSNR